VQAAHAEEPAVGASLDGEQSDAFRGVQGLSPVSDVVGLLARDRAAEVLDDFRVSVQRRIER